MDIQCQTLFNGEYILAQALADGTPLKSPIKVWGGGYVDPDKAEAIAQELLIAARKARVFALDSGKPPR